MTSHICDVVSNIKTQQILKANLYSLDRMQIDLKKK